MQRNMLIFCVFSMLFAGSIRAADEPLDEFLADAKHVEAIKTIGQAIVSQVDPDIARKATMELRRSFWASKSDAELSPQEAASEWLKFETSWKLLSDLIRQREIKSISFVGLDHVLLGKSQDWYFGAATPRGPVLIRVSVQISSDSPLTLFAVRVWTGWAEIKEVTHLIDLPAIRQIITVTYDEKPALR